jgi:hypothetical protein
MPLYQYLFSLYGQVLDTLPDFRPLLKHTKINGDGKKNY